MANTIGNFFLGLFIFYGVAVLVHVIEEYLKEKK